MTEATATTVTAPEPTATPVDPPEGGGVDQPAAVPTPMTGQEATPPPADPLAAQKAELEKRFEAASKHELRQRALKRDLETKHSALTEREKALEAREKRAQELESEWQLFQDNPLEWAERRNVDPDTLAERILRPKTPEQRKIAEIEEKLTKKEQAERDAAEKREKARQERERQENLAQLVATLNPEDHPHTTSVYEPWEIPDVVDRELQLAVEVDMGDGQVHRTTVLQHFIDTNGRLPTLTEVADYLETRTKARISKLKPVAATPAPAPANGTQPAVSPGVTTQASPNGQANTLTNNHAAEVASGRPGKKSREEVRSELIRQLEAEDGANQ